MGIARGLPRSICESVFSWFRLTLLGMTDTNAWATALNVPLVLCTVLDKRLGSSCLGEVIEGWIRNMSRPALES